MNDRLWEPAIPQLTVGSAQDPASTVALACWPAPGGESGIRLDPAAAVAGWQVEQLMSALGRLGATGQAGEVTAIPGLGPKPTELLVVGLGEACASDARRAGANLARRCRGRVEVADRVASELLHAGPALVTAWLEGILLGGPGLWLGGAGDVREPVRRVHLVSTRDDEVELANCARTAGIGGGATLLARRLAATPANRKSPAWLAKVAADVAEKAGLSATIWDGAQLRSHGMGGLLAVGAGSTRGPVLVQLAHRPAGATRHVVLVGKGITFDSGGLSLKAPDMMVSMKTDMSGAAAVLAAMSALDGCSVAVTALLCLAENLPGAAATRPGDVVAQYGGRTSEVRNTDAEGRLVLADGLAYAAEQLTPDVLLDIATLTGAATLGLGRGHAAMYATTPELAAGLRAAADRSGERVWQLPLHPGYSARIESAVADAANADVGAGSGPGSITAALFLQPFTGGLPWAHLDIAGPARSDADTDDRPKGATGYGARLILEWLKAGAPA